jgi:CubicO group peptidase (beta-lactamase class C family)
MKKISAFVLLLLALPVQAQPVVPDSVMGRTLSDYLSAFNSADAARIDAFNSAHHFDMSAADQLGFFRQSGGFILKKIESSDATSVTALVQEKDSDAILRMTIRETGTAKAPKLSIQLGDIPRPAEYAIPRLTQADAIKALDARAAKLAAQDRLSGAMLIARKGKIIYSHSWGLADRARKTPVTLDTKFRLGSDNKMFTAVATLQLVAAGKLKLDGKLGDYLPDYPNKDLAQKVTIRMLLTHSGGTGDFFGPEFDKNRLTLKHNEDYVALFGDRAPAFEPGSKERYSNFGFILLGSIVQHVSGEDYYDYVLNHIFRPAGMSNTDSLPEATNVPDRAVAYTFKDGNWTDAADTLPSRGMAAGGGYSTARDLLKFAQALESGKLLPQTLKEQATHFQTKGKWYGFGFAIYGEDGPTHWYGHGGGAPGMNADLRVFPESGTVIVTLANVDPPVANRLAEFYINRMPLN